MDCKIFPSLLSADITRLGEEVEAAIQAGADAIHLDVMDNHYVPNLTFGPFVCAQLHQRFPETALDVHLMVTPVDELITQFAKSGATRISIHPDATIHLDRSLHLIQQLGCQAGIALNPSASIDCLTWCSERLDFVLVMTVNPGFGGQSLIPALLKKITALREVYPSLPITVDGGINLDTILPAATAGATQFVIGQALFKTPDYRQTIHAFRERLRLTTGIL